ncbi:MAG: 2-dehydropantoate 2-reductase [Leptospirales bacterium]|nr:2-dehydropantoate 2-reductase [Leptospirales bacterium]
MIMPKIALLGTGAIGASVARALYLNKVPFDILVRDDARKNELIQNGISFSMKGALTRIPLMETGDYRAIRIEQGGEYDYVLLGMKATHLPASLNHAWKLAPNGRVVLLQNGLPEEVIQVTAQEAPRIVAGIVGYNVQLLPDGVFFQSNPGHLIFGTVPGQALATALKVAIEPWIPVIITDNGPGYRWNKLAINCVINGLGALSGQTLGAIFANRAGRVGAIRILEETGTVMQHLGIKEEIVPGGLSVFKFGQKGSWPGFLQHLVLRILGMKYSKVKTSMLQDIENKRATEVDAIQGAVVEAARKAKIPTPILSEVVEKIRAIESGKAKPGAENLTALAGNS